MAGLSGLLSFLPADSRADGPGWVNNWPFGPASLSLPAGLLGRGERPVDGCARELAEESGLRLRPEDFTPAVPNAVVHTRGMWVDTVFEARVPASTATLEVDGAEVVEAGWHRLDSLPPISVATARLLAHYGIGPYADFPEARG